MRYCEEYAALLDCYVDGELSPEEMARVQAHLDTCPGCRAYVDDALAIRAALPGVEETEVPEGFAEQVLEAVRSREAAAKPRRKTPWMKVLVPLAACFALVLLVQSRTFGGGSTESAAPPQSAAQDAAVPYAADSGGAAEEKSLARADENTTAEMPEIAPAGIAESAPAGESGSGAAADSGGAVSQAPVPAGEDGAAPEPRVKTNLMAQEAPVALPVLTLTAEEAGELLAAYTPVQETETAYQYLLSAAEYAALLDALGQADAPQSHAALTGGDAGTERETVLVEVLK